MCVLYTAARGIPSSSAKMFPSEQQPIFPRCFHLKRGSLAPAKGKLLGSHGSSVMLQPSLHPSEVICVHCSLAPSLNSTPRSCPTSPQSQTNSSYTFSAALSIAKGYTSALPAAFPLSPSLQAAAIAILHP